jgi:hypothetical protein
VVRGSAAPRTGADGKRYETRFELRLPTAWSGRFLYQGDGGNDGVVAFSIVARDYGRAPDRKYFVGCSGGGRQGMMFAQRCGIDRACHRPGRRSTPRVVALRALESR